MFCKFLCCGGESNTEVLDNRLYLIEIECLKDKIKALESSLIYNKLELNNTNAVLKAKTKTFKNKENKLNNEISILKENANILRRKLQNNNDPILENSENILNYLCCICMDRERNIVNSPCNHINMCNDCFLNLKEFKCPVCRANIINYTQVYF